MRSGQGGETHSRKNWQALLYDWKGELSHDDTKVREQVDSGSSSQMVTLSSSPALAPSSPKAKVTQPGRSACFWKWGFTHSILPICPRFSVLVVISCNSHLQGGKGYLHRRADNSFVHHNRDKYISIVPKFYWQLLFWEEEKGRRKLYI